MPDTGAPFNLPYPASSDLVRNAPTDFQDLAEQVEEYLLFEETGPQTSDYTLALTDTSKIVAMNASGTATLTVPTNAAVPFPTGSVVGVYNAAGSAVTVRNAGDILQYQEVSLRKRGTDEWVLL